MLSDQSDHMPAQVAADVAKVHKAYDAALTEIRGSWFSNQENESGLTGMANAIDVWAKRGTDAAKTRDGKPGDAGWPGWTKAGEVFLDGIADIRGTAKGDKLDAITAQALDVPKTTAQATAKATKAIADKAVKTAKAAVDVGVSGATAAGSVWGAFEGASFLSGNAVLIIGGLLAYKYIYKRGRKK